MLSVGVTWAQMLPLLYLTLQLLVRCSLRFLRRHKYSLINGSGPSCIRMLLWKYFATEINHFLCKMSSSLRTSFHDLLPPVPTLTLPHAFAPDPIPTLASLSLLSATALHSERKESG